MSVETVFTIETVYTIKIAALTSGGERFSFRRISRGRAGCSKGGDEGNKKNVESATNAGLTQPGAVIQDNNQHESGNNKH